MWARGEEGSEQSVNVDAPEFRHLQRESHESGRRAATIWGWDASPLGWPGASASNEPVSSESQTSLVNTRVMHWAVVCQGAENVTDP